MVDSILTKRPNIVSQEYDTFYVSYNDSDVRTYGDVTTALVLEPQMSTFYILNGDHREEYAAIGNNLEKCIEYFLQNSDKINKYSDKAS